MAPHGAGTFLEARDPVQARYEQDRALAVAGAAVAAPDWTGWLRARRAPAWRVVSVEAADAPWAPRAERREQRLGRVLRALLAGVLDGESETAELR